MKKLILFVLLAAVSTAVVIFIRRSIPYSDRPELFSDTISIDSIWSVGPATGIYDKGSKKYYWLKSMTSLDHPIPDTLKSRKVNIRYMKFLAGPLENRIFRIEVDSVVIFDQVIERK